MTLILEFKVNFLNSRFSGIVGKIDVNSTGSDSISNWNDYITLTCDHTHDPKFEIALSKEWEDRLTWYQIYVSHPFMKQRTRFTLDKEGLKLHWGLWVIQLFNTAEKVRNVTKSLGTRGSVLRITCPITECTGILKRFYVLFITHVHTQSLLHSREANIPTKNKLKKINESRLCHIG